MHSVCHGTCYALHGGMNTQQTSDVPNDTQTINALIEDIFESACEWQLLTQGANHEWALDGLSSTIGLAMDLAHVAPCVDTRDLVLVLRKMYRECARAA